MEGAGAVNAVREDPKKRGLLYASTENGVYVSFDDGERLAVAAAEPAGLVGARPHRERRRPRGRRRTGAASGFSTTSRGCGRSTARRPREDAVLFKPAAAWRVRWNTSTDMPWPKDEPTIAESAGGNGDRLLPEVRWRPDRSRWRSSRRPADSFGGTRAPIRCRPCRLPRRRSAGAALLVSPPQRLVGERRHASVPLGSALPAARARRRWRPRRFAHSGDSLQQRAGAGDAAGDSRDIHGEADRQRQEPVADDDREAGSASEDARRWCSRTCTR